MARNDDVSLERASAVQAVAIPLPHIDGAHDLIAVMSNAAFKVVSQVGFEKATANRLSRAAGRDFSQTYGQYTSKEVLMDVITAAHMSQMVAMSLTPFFGLDRGDYVRRSTANGAALCAEVNRPYRQLRIETVLAGRHHPSITDSITKEFSKSRTHFRTLVSDTFPSDVESLELAAQLVWLAIRCNSFGTSLICSSTSQFEKLDWSPASSALFDVLVDRGLARES